MRTVGVVHRGHPARERVQAAPVQRRSRVRRGRPSIAPPPNVIDVAIIPEAIAGCRVECHIARTCCLRISGSEESTSPYLEVSICKAGTFISLIIFIRCNHIIFGNIARIISCCNGSEISPYILRRHVITVGTRVIDGFLYICNRSQYQAGFLILQTTAPQLIGCFEPSAPLFAGCAAKIQL